MSDDLIEGQFSLDGFVFGEGTDYLTNPPAPGAPEITAGDVARDQSDGVRFGRDFRAGRTITFDIDLHNADDVWEAAAKLEAAWLADPVRLKPGAKSTLRYCRHGKLRRVYGRPRKLEGKLDNAWAADNILYTGEFITEDHKFYADEQQTAVVDFVPPESGGLVSPVVAPVTTVARSSVQGQYTNGGVVATPPVITIYGPISNPTVELLNQWKFSFTGTLASDDYVVVDPSAGTVLTHFQKNWAGKFTADSPALSELLLPVGPGTIVLRGTDQTGTSRVELAWRDAYTSF